MRASLDGKVVLDYTLEELASGKVGPGSKTQYDGVHGLHRHAGGETSAAPNVSLARGAVAALALATLAARLDAQPDAGHSRRDAKAEPPWCSSR
jgi:hypothetical protein